MLVTLALLSASVALFLGMLALIWLGRAIGTRRVEGEAPAGARLLDGAVFSLLGFMVALTYSGAESRFQGRRQQIIEEANNISSAYQLVDLVPAAAQPALRDTFRRYVDARIMAFEKLPDIGVAQQQLAESKALQKDIWRQTLAAIRNEPTSTTTVLLPALNRMADTATLRDWRAQSHAAFVTFGLLFVIALTCSFLAGVGIGRRKSGLIHIIAFAAIFAVTMYAMFELEFPRAGIVRIQDFDQALIDVRSRM
jgi:hypothetical protein